MSALKQKLIDIDKVLSDVRFQIKFLKDVIFILVVVLVAEGLIEVINEGIPIGLRMLR